VRTGSLMPLTRNRKRKKVSLNSPRRRRKSVPAFISASALYFVSVSAFAESFLTEAEAKNKTETKAEAKNSRALGYSALFI